MGWENVVVFANIEEIRVDIVVQLHVNGFAWKTHAGQMSGRSFDRGTTPPLAVWMRRASWGPGWRLNAPLEVI